jgi:hypothetical protein
MFNHFPIDQANGNGEIKTLQFYHKNMNPHLILVSSADKYFVYCLNKQAVIENILLKKK